MRRVARLVLADSDPRGRPPILSRANKVSEALSLYFGPALCSGGEGISYPGVTAAVILPTPKQPRLRLAHYRRQVQFRQSCERWVSLLDGQNVSGIPVGFLGFSLTFSATGERAYTATQIRVIGHANRVGQVHRADVGTCNQISKNQDHGQEESKTIQSVERGHARSPRPSSALANRPTSLPSHVALAPSRNPLSGWPTVEMQRRRTAVRQGRDKRRPIDAGGRIKVHAVEIVALVALIANPFGQKSAVWLACRELSRMQTPGFVACDPEVNRSRS